jgi:hypothetical protein
MRAAMPASPLPAARLLPRTIVLLACTALASCATKKTPAPATTGATAAASPTPAPSPAPAATPSPNPTPQARYSARVMVDGQVVTQQEIQPGSTPPPAATPATAEASPTPTPAPTPSPTPKPNIFSQAWQKIFPPKPTPAPTPGPTGRVTMRVTTADGQPVEQVVSEGDPTAPSAAAPTPVPAPTPPRENFIARMWHKIFPKKEPPPSATLPQWIGTIKLVNERDGYVLIDSEQGYYPLAAGEVLNAVGGGSESGVVRVTADRNPPFFIADIVGGKPRAGDRVYSPKP